MAFLGDVFWRILRTRLFDSVRPKIIRSDAYRLEGKMRFSGSVFSTVVVGSKVSVEYFSKLFYVTRPTVEFLGKLSFEKVASSVWMTKTDLTIVAVNCFFSGFLRDNGFFVSPQLNFVLNINDSLENIQKRVSEGKQRKLKQVAEAGYTYEVTNDLSKLESFYYNMYLPHMLRRHSGSALPISFSVCRSLFLRGKLLLIKSGEECISGVILVPQGNELWAPILAVGDIDKKLTLGSYAVYYFSILVGLQRGFARMDFGDAPPFMQDGLFQFKKGFDMWVRPANPPGAQVFGVRFSGVGAFVRRFLSDTPFVFVDDGGLSGLVFLESVDDLSVKSFCVSGLASLYVVSSSVDVSGLKDFKWEKLGVKGCLGDGVSVLSFLGRVCAEGKYSIYRLTW